MLEKRTKLRDFVLEKRTKAPDRKFPTVFRPPSPPVSTGGQLTCALRRSWVRFENLRGNAQIFKPYLFAPAARTAARTHRLGVLRPPSIVFRLSVHRLPSLVSYEESPERTSPNISIETKNLVLSGRLGKGRREVSERKQGKLVWCRKSGQEEKLVKSTDVYLFKLNRCQIVKRLMNATSVVE